MTLLGLINRIVFSPHAIKAFSAAAASRSASAQKRRIVSDTRRCGGICGPN